VKHLVVSQFTQIKENEQIPYSAMCDSSCIPYSTFMRWRDRVESGQEPCQEPGPKKIEPLDIDVLNRSIENLDHGKKRTSGTGRLYRSMSEGISRRALQRLITDARTEKNRLYRESLTRIVWTVPGAAWAMDDTEYMEPCLDGKFHLHAMRDMASRYGFKPLSGLQKADGPLLAQNLVTLFEKYGPPLFMKRDNGANLNHSDVNRVLSDWMVLPLNSPPYYPLYNGSIEQAQRELKSRLTTKQILTLRELQLQAEIIASDLNHQQRPCLNGRTACSVFFEGKSQMKMFHRRKRKEVYDKILTDALRLVDASENILRFDIAWRISVKMWLQKNHMIEVSKREKCYPFFKTIFTHN
jgi:hypothetical protein